MIERRKHKPHLIERDQPLQELSGLCQQLTQQGGRIALVYGEAGIGKSTLIEQFITDLDAATHHAIGLCDPLNTPIPMGAVQEISQQLLHQRNLLSVESSPPWPQQLYELLSHTTAPLVVVVEDVHWADQGTLDWLKFIGRRIRALPLLLIISYRDDEVVSTHPLSSTIGQIPSQYMHRIPLQPLSLSGIEALDLPAGMQAEQLLEITGGNPFFLTELLNDNAAATHSSVPASVLDAVNSRINRLDAGLRKFLETVSCCPTTLRTDTLHAVFGDGYVDHLAESTRLQLLIARRGHFRFRHELTRLATYARLSASERQHAHGRLLASLLQETRHKLPVDEIVHHALGAQDATQILTFAPLAAAEAARMGAHREAERYLKDTLEYIDHATPELAAQIYEDWAYEAALAQQINDDVIEARRMAITIWRTLGRMDKVGENLRWLSRLHWYRGEAIKANRYVQDAVEVLENEAPSAGKAMAYAVRAQFHMLQDRMAEAVEWGNLSLAMASSIDAHEVTTHALNTVGTARLFRGDAEGEQCLRESLRIARQHNLHEQAARVYTNLSECAIEAREFDKADVLLKEGIAFDVEHDLDAWTYYLIGRHAQLRLEQDQLREAVQIADGALAQPNQTLLMLLPARIARSRALLRLGDSEAGKALQQAKEDALQVDEPQYTAAVRAIQIEAACLAGDTDLAAHYYADAIALAADQLSPAKWSDLVFWSQQAGVVTEDAQRLPLQPAIQLLLAGQTEQAIATCEAQSAHYLAAWCRWQLGTATSIAQADEHFRSIGAVAAQNHLRRNLKNSELALQLEPVPRGPNSFSRNHPYGLTRKEQIVLSHMIEGASNASIARALSRSVRTVENHVSAILGKLNASNRAEVIVRVQGEPWLLD